MSFINFYYKSLYICSCNFWKNQGAEDMFSHNEKCALRVKLEQGAFKEYLNPK